MVEHWILTVVSDDKPGVVKQVADTVASNGGNWLESQLTQLAGKFAGVIHISASPESIETLEHQLRALQTNGIKINIDSMQPVSAHAALPIAHFSAVGPDRRGIVLEISQAFAAYNINVEELTTRCSSMAYSGDPMFEAEGVISLPDGTDWEQLTDQLHELADALALDIQLEQNHAGGQG